MLAPWLPITCCLGSFVFIYANLRSCLHYHKPINTHCELYIGKQLESPEEVSFFILGYSLLMLSQYFVQPDFSIRINIWNFLQAILSKLTFYYKCKKVCPSTSLCLQIHSGSIFMAMLKKLCVFRALTCWHIKKGKDVVWCQVKYLLAVFHVSIWQNKSIFLPPFSLLQMSSYQVFNMGL